MTDRFRVSGGLVLLVLLSPAVHAHSTMDLGARLRVPSLLRAGATERIEAIADVRAFDPAAAVTFTVEIDNGTFTNASAGAAWRCTREAKRVRCTADEAEPGPHTFSIDVAAPASGTATITASVSSIASDDPVGANDRARVTSRVYSAASCNAAPPALVSASTATGVTELSWSAVPGAESYEVLVSVDGELPRRIATTSGTRTTTRLLTGDVTWSVRATFADCPSVPSEPASFSAGAAAPALRVSSIRSPLFTEPVAVAFEGDSVLVSDAGQRRLRAYDPITGHVSDVPLIDGTGDPAVTLDGGIAVGLGDFLYIADRSNELVRFVLPFDRAVFVAAGTANTPGSADGVGKAARVRAPVGIVVTDRSVVYVADSGNDAIRRIVFDVSKANFATTTFAGASAGLDDPAGLALDAGGNLLVADRGNHVIRRISPAGVVTTIAGVAGEDGHRDGDAEQALFDSPFGIAVDPWGNIFVSDEASHTIRKIAPNGRVTTVAGRPGVAGDNDGLGSAALFNRPGLLAVGSDGVLWIADRGNGTLRRAEAGAAAPKRRVTRQ